MFRLYKRVHGKWLPFLLLAFLSVASADAGEGKMVEEDTDKDGKTDRIAFFDASGNMTELNADTDGDGRMDTFQFYEKGVPVRLERDTDADGHVDEQETLKNGKRSVVRKLNASGRVVGVIYFDAKERPVKSEQDSTDNGLMDTVSVYSGGKLQTLTRDTDGDGRVNVRQTYKNGKIREQKSDTDGDGRFEQIVTYDGKGNPAESRHDVDGDGHQETVRRYRNGEIFVQEQYGKGRKRPETVTEYSGGAVCSEKKDTDGDGTFDVTVRMKAGRPLERETDLDHDGRTDRTTEFDPQGRPMIIREYAEKGGQPTRTTRYRNGRIESVEELTEGGRVFTRFENDRPVIQTTDVDGDGRPDKTLSFDEQGRLQSAETDENRDGRTDARQSYKNGRLDSAEQDRDGDGKADARIAFAGEKQKEALLDNDGDGYFETKIHYDDPNWSRVTEIFNPGDQLKERHSFSGNVLRKKEVFHPSTGRPVMTEEYGADGRIVLSGEAADGADTLNMTWHYDAEEKPVLAEKDTDGDGRTEIWYYYEAGRLARVEEDRNSDGKPDMWETYNAARKLILRKLDVNFDGTADIEKRF